MVTDTKGGVISYLLWKFDSQIANPDIVTGLLCTDTGKLIENPALHPSFTENAVCWHCLLPVSTRS
jgi:hypothetical protein